MRVFLQNADSAPAALHEFFSHNRFSLTSPEEAETIITFGDTQTAFETLRKFSHLQETSFQLISDNKHFFSPAVTVQELNQVFASSFLKLKTTLLAVNVCVGSRPGSRVFESVRFFPTHNSPSEHFGSAIVSSGSERETFALTRQPIQLFTAVGAMYSEDAVLRLNPRSRSCLLQTIRCDGRECPRSASLLIDSASTTKFVFESDTFLELDGNEPVQIPRKTEIFVSALGANYQHLTTSSIFGAIEKKS